MFHRLCAASIMYFIRISKNCFGTSKFSDRWRHSSLSVPCRAPCFCCCCFWFAVWDNNSVRTCAHGNTLLLYPAHFISKNTLYNAYISITCLTVKIYDIWRPRAGLWCTISIYVVHSCFILKHHTRMYLTEWDYIVHVSIFHKKSYWMSVQNFKYSI